MNYLEPGLIILIVIVVLIDAVMKAIAMWKSARNNHLAWFICIAVFNTAGVLPIIYLLLHREQKEPVNI